MSNTHRLTWLDSKIRANLFPNATGLARAFEISTRQAARDIEYLRYTLGAPLSYCYIHKGYYYTEQSFYLPNIHVTREQSATLLGLSRTYELIPEDHAQNMAELFRRLTVLIPQREVDHFAAIPSDSQLLSGPCSVTVNITHPGLVDFAGVKATDLGSGKYSIHSPDYRALLIFLLCCPSEFKIVSPNWLRLKFRKIVEKTLHQLLD